MAENGAQVGEPRLTVEVMSLPPPEVCDRARRAKDARFDGLFFTAVRSTGIYCRPVCPATTPKPEHISYFPTAAAATAAGYRPCLRCRPELAPESSSSSGDPRVQQALELIADGMLEEASVSQLAQRVGLSGRQLRRLFLAHAGATPLTVHATRRLLLAKQLLTESSLTLTDVALAAGFQSLRRFNVAFRESCGMAPSSIRRLQAASVPTTPLTVRLAYRPPFDFSAMLAFLARRAIPGIERVDEQAYERVVGTAAAPARIRVTARAGKPELLLGISHIEPGQIPGVVRRVRKLFDLDANMAEVDSVLGETSVLAQAVARHPGLRVPGAWDGFELAVRAVLGQQVSVAGATTLSRRLVDTYGGLSVDGFGRFFPNPAALIEAPLEKLGLPQSRATTLRELSKAVCSEQVHFGAGQSAEAFVARFCELPGIGPWTAQYVAMRALGAPDAFPSGDLVLQQVLGGLRRLTARQTEARSQRWRPWRAYATVQLWQLAADRAQERR